MRTIDRWGAIAGIAGVLGVPSSIATAEPRDPTPQERIDVAKENCLRDQLEFHRMVARMIADLFGGGENDCSKAEKELRFLSKTIMKECTIAFGLPPENKPDVDISNVQRAQRVNFRSLMTLFRQIAERAVAVCRRDEKTTGPNQAPIIKDPEAAEPSSPL